MIGRKVASFHITAYKTHNFLWGEKWTLLVTFHIVIIESYFLFNKILLKQLWCDLELGILITDMIFHMNILVGFYIISPPQKINFLDN